MKRIFFLMIAAVVVINLSAQEFAFDGIEVPDRSFTISVGPKAGVNFSTMSNPDGMDLGLKSGLGFNGGVAANMHFGRRTQASRGGTGWFGLQVEALYSQRVVKTDFDDIKISYFEVPILAQCYVIPSVCIELGPTIAGTLNSSPDHISLNNVSIATGEIKGFDVMLTAGASYKHKSGFTASARYNVGTSELAGNFSSKMNMLTVSVGWLFSVVK